MDVPLNTSMTMQLAIDLIRHPEVLALFARASKDDGPGVR
jgi:hypothetical protein